ncbi:alpha-galactosidase [Cellulomonas citrea]|uniref:alpha-galactosidase n=1 Tax=Cellulomonas citrea TaxID=1909423 RepID=UPI00135BE7D4|nr:alpha-galactosidase [Cellulomonas citrea]
MDATARLLHLRRGGTSLVLRLDDDVLPAVLHWGPDLGEGDVTGMLTALAVPVGDSVATAAPVVSVLPQQSSGWLGRPGLLGSRAGQAWSVAFDHVEHELDEAGTAAWPDGASGAVRLRSVGTDGPDALTVTTELELHPSGLVRLRAAVRNDGADGYEVRALEPALPVPAEAGELLDLTGRYSHERSPQRRPFDQGTWVRESWGGRPGHDSATVLCAGRPSFGFRAGRVWGVHLAWSGNGAVAAEQLPSGWRLLRGGELLLPGEVRLASGEQYTSPWLVGSWGEGLDALAARIHRTWRARPTHPRTPRPVLLNTWEAVYFDHDLPHLLDLADKAAALGVERFVLDDGWFRGRRHDRAGLGDWEVDPDVWPQGLAPLADRVHALGMQFGLWFEPEMVNLDSDVARAHPDWVLGTSHGPGLPSRQQHVLDLGHPDAYAHVRDRMVAVIAGTGVDYLKWDHNRPLLDAGHGPDRTPGVHAQTLAAYRLMDELKGRFPGLEIESCAAGGARVDLGVMDRCDRVWVSDCIDAHERQRLQRWTSLLLPPEMLGTHIGADKDHSTGRVLDLTYRAGTALWGHLGIEWDLSATSAEQLAALAGWVRLHKELRPLLHSGDVVHADPTNPALWLEGVVAPDRSEAVYRLAAVEHTLTWPPGRVTLPGLDPDRRYEVQVLPPAVPVGQVLPGWVRDGVELPGRVLGTVGLAAPLLDPDMLVLLRVRAVEG